MSAQTLDSVETTTDRFVSRSAVHGGGLKVEDFIIVENDVYEITKFDGCTVIGTMVTLGMGFDYSRYQFIVRNVRTGKMSRYLTTNRVLTPRARKSKNRLLKAI